MEVVYSMMHTPDGMHGQLTLQVIRFYAPVLRPDGTFHGVLMLSLDLSTLRDTISNFSQAGADAEALQNSNMHTVYVDKEGWMIFQDAEHGKTISKAASIPCALASVVISAGLATARLSDRPPASTTATGP